MDWSGFGQIITDPDPGDQKRTDPAVPYRPARCTNLGRGGWWVASAGGRPA